MITVEPEPYVVMLVCSAGGVAALSAIIGGLPPSLPAAVVVLQHTAPGRDSPLVHILQRRTRWPVVAVQDGATVETGTVAVAPPGSHTLVTPARTFSLIKSGPYPPARPSADLLLTSAALAVGPAAVAVVLTGAGHDGATGATVVHKHGGAVLATDEDTSTFFSMPRAAIRRDHVVDRVLGLDEVAGHIAAVVSEPPVIQGRP